MLPIILIVIYTIGIIIWMQIEKKYFPYKEGEYTIEFDGAQEITPEMHNDIAIFRSVLWPFFLTFIILLLSILMLLMLKEIFEKL